ncbi:MAG: primosomal protein N', partial [Candidatus Omnitrophica bacterium]|nr:primosomal protein N' [Candidatus Omnitrophota bacterium]
GSISPSLESFYLAKKGKIKYTLLPRSAGYPQVKIVDMLKERRYFKQRNIILSKYLQDCIVQTLEAKGKILLFLNRRGFATFASCRNCGEVLKCPRCNINLVYYFKESILNCRYCNFKMVPPQICPSCNAAYMRYSGMGTEKIESEISRQFPNTRVLRLDQPREIDIDKADIFISTASIIKKTNYNFDLIGVLSIDNSLSRIDFRSTEKTIALLIGLLAFTENKIVIQTNLPRHYSLQAIENRDINIYYNEELSLRKQLDFPPYRHMCMVKLRGKIESSVQETSNALFDGLNKYAQGNKAIKIVSLNPGQPAKLRGNFYWQILIKSSFPSKIVSFLRLYLKKFRHSGIIVTIDMDPA